MKKPETIEPPSAANKWHRGTPRYNADADPYYRAIGDARPLPHDWKEQGIPMSQLFGRGALEAPLEPIFEALARVKAGKEQSLKESITTVVTDRNQPRVAPRAIVQFFGPESDLVRAKEAAVKAATEATNRLSKAQSESIKLITQRVSLRGKVAAVQTQIYDLQSKKARIARHLAQAESRLSRAISVSQNMSMFNIAEGTALVARNKIAAAEIERLLTDAEAIGARCRADLSEFELKHAADLEEVGF